MIFSVHGSEANCYDLPSMLFLPEFLARFSIPGQIMMSSSKAGTSVPPVISQPRRQNWRNEIWEEHRYEPNALKRLLRSLLPRTFHKPLDRMFGAARGTRLVSPQQPPADIVSSATLGTVGPIPFRETGGHRPEGFLVACGQGIAENSTLRPG
jgi:hypothetical protein